MKNNRKLGEGKLSCLDLKTRLVKNYSQFNTELETLASRTIAERGVQLIGTAHGNSFDNLIKNPILVDLIGGIQYVTLGDEEARQRGTQKSVIERKSCSSFNIGIEISNSKAWVVHPNIENTVDSILRNASIEHQFRLYCFNNYRKIIKCRFSNTDSLYLSKSNLYSLINIKPFGLNITEPIRSFHIEL